MGFNSGFKGLSNKPIEGSEILSLGKLSTSFVTNKVIYFLRNKQTKCYDSSDTDSRITFCRM